MRILVLAPQPFFRVRGTPINIRNLVQAMAAGGHQVDLLCYPFGEPVDLPGVRILRSPGFPGIRDVKVGPSPAKIPLDVLMALRAFRLVRRERYDLIHAVEESAFFAVWLSRWFRTKLVYDMDSVISDQLAYSGFLTNRFLLRRVENLERRTLRRAVRVVTVCESLSEAVRRLCPEARIVQIEDTPPTERFEPDLAGAAALRETWGLGGGPVVVYTGNFESYQGVDLLVAGWETVRERVPEARLLLVGGEERHRQALQAVAGPGIVFTGPMPPEQMPACLTLAEVLVSPRSKGTNTAMKIYGYMQAGRGLVATALETHTQVLDESCSWLVPPTPEGLAQGLVRALQNKEEAARRGTLAAQRVEERFGKARFQRQVLSMLEEIGGAAT